jgi:hypothetical protein
MERCHSVLTQRVRYISLLIVSRLSSRNELRLDAETAETTEVTSGLRSKRGVHSMDGILIDVNRNDTPAPS